MHKKSTFVFWTTLILYLVTLFTVSYVGVYLTYIALPVIIISGLIMKLTSDDDIGVISSNEIELTTISSEKSDLNISSEADITPKSRNTLSDKEGFISGVSNYLKLNSMKSNLLHKYLQDHKHIKNSLSHVNHRADTYLKHCNKNEKEFYKLAISKIMGKVSLVESHMNTVKDELEVEISNIISKDISAIDISREIENVTLKGSTLELGQYILADSEYFLGIVDKSIDGMNEQTVKLKEKWNKINLLGIEPSVFIKHETDPERKKQYQEKIDEVENILSLVDDEIYSIAKKIESNFLIKIQDKSNLDQVEVC